MNSTQKKYVTALVFILAFILFTVLVKTVDTAPVGPCDTQVGMSGINVAFHSLTGENPTLYKITNLCGYALIAAVCIPAVAGLVQLIKRKRLMKVDAGILSAGCLYVLTGLIYLLFEFVVINYRPVLMDGETFPEASYPSSHTFLACVVAISLAVLALTYVTSKPIRVTAVAVLSVLLVVTVIGRAWSGVHWLTDIVGSLLLSAGLIALFLGFTDTVEKSGREK